MRMKLGYDIRRLSIKPTPTADVRDVIYINNENFINVVENEIYI